MLLRCIIDTKLVTAGLMGLQLAADLIKDAQVVAFPTETVYGLGADALKKQAVNHIFEAKGRPADNPLIVHVASIDQVGSLAASVSEKAKVLMERFWPGPLTLIFDKQPSVPNIVTAGLDTVAIRMPDHAFALEIIKESGTPIAAPSANLSGKPSPTTAQAVMHDMHGRVPLIIDGGPCAVGLESTVLDVTSKTPAILRPGAITQDMLEEVIGKVTVDKTISKPLKKNEEARSPGMKYTHYAPKAKLTIVKGGGGDVSRYINNAMASDRQAGLKAMALCFKENQRSYGVDRIVLGSKYRVESVAEMLYENLRKLDELEVDAAYSEALPMEGIALAVMNRLIRAAGYRIINL